MGRKLKSQTEVELMKTIAANIRDQLEVIDSNVYRMSNKANVCPSAFYKMSSGKALPSLPILLRIADYLGVTLDYLVS